MRILTKILSSISIIFITLIIIVSFNQFNYNPIYDFDDSLLIEFVQNDENNFLYVSKINVPIDWSYIEKQGLATKPYGEISIGDKITNCYGEVELFYGDSSLGTWSFSKKYPDEYYNIHFNGLWENVNEEYDLRYDNYYRCEPSFEVQEPILLCNIIESDGYYDINETAQNFIFPKKYDPDVFISFNYYLDEDNDKLFLYDQNLSNNTILFRNIRKIKTSLDISNYTEELINISGFFNSNKTNNFGYLKYNESYEEIIISFEFYDENNSSYYDNKTIEISGYIFNPNESDIWVTPYVKYIDSIKIIQ